MFQFKLSYGKEDFLALNRAMGRTLQRGRRRLRRVIYLLFGVVFLFFGALFLTAQIYVSGAVISLGGTYFLVLAVFYDRVSAWRSRRLQIEGVEELTIDLEEEGVRARSPKGEEFTRYSSFIGLLYLDGRYFLPLDKLHALILPEAALTKGDAAALRSWLERKLGRETVQLKK